MLPKCEPLIIPGYGSLSVEETIESPKVGLTGALRAAALSQRPAILFWIWIPCIILTLLLVVKSAFGDDVGWILRSADTGHEVVVLQLDQAPAGAVVELWSASESIKLPAADVVDWVKQKKRERR